MADLFAGIFNDLPDSLGDWIGTGLEGALGAATSKRSGDNLDSLIDTLGKSSSPGDYGASKSQAVKSEDPFAFEQVWKVRFKSFLE